MSFEEKVSDLSWLPSSEGGNPRSDERSYRQLFLERCFALYLRTEITIQDVCDKCVEELGGGGRAPHWTDMLKDLHVGL